MSFRCFKQNLQIAGREECWIFLMLGFSKASNW